MVDIVANTDELDQLIDSWIPTSHQHTNTDDADNNISHHASTSRQSLPLQAATGNGHTHSHRIGIGVSNDDAAAYIKDIIADKKLRKQLKLSVNKRKHHDDDSDDDNDNDKKVKDRKKHKAASSSAHGDSDDDSKVHSMTSKSSSAGKALDYSTFQQSIIQSAIKHMNKDIDTKKQRKKKKVKQKHKKVDHGADATNSSVNDVIDVTGMDDEHVAASNVVANGDSLDVKTGTEFSTGHDEKENNHKTNSTISAQPSPQLYSIDRSAHEADHDVITETILMNGASKQQHSAASTSSELPHKRKKHHSKQHNTHRALHKSHAYAFTSPRVKHHGENDRNNQNTIGKSKYKQPIDTISTTPTHTTRTPLQSTRTHHNKSTLKYDGNGKRIRQPKKRSKQKNMKKDNRPAHLKPRYKLQIDNEKNGVVATAIQL